MIYHRFVILLALLVFGGATYAAGPYGTQAGQPYNNSGQVILDETVAQALADTGAGIVRVNFRLGNQPSDNSTWYAAYDGIVNRLRSRGLEVIGLMTNEARPWAPQADWIANNHEVAGGDGWNSYLNGWCQAFLRYATHWQGKIKYWELWNEPDCLSVIYPSNFAALLSHAYDLAHTNNLNVEIISGGVCGVGCEHPDYGAAYIIKTYDMGINHTGLFTQMNTKWGTYPLDHIGFHIYPFCGGTLDTTWLSNYFECMHNAYTTYEGTGTTKKMFLTEMGWMASATGCSGCCTTEAIQASNLTSAYNIINSKSFIKCATWFFLKDEPSADLYHGVFRSTGYTESDKKPGWTNMKTAFTYEGRWSASGNIDQPILDYYNARGHAQMGNPYDNGGTAWVHNWDFGPVQDFDTGVLGRMIVADSADGVAYTVRGNFFPVILANHINIEFPLCDQFFTGIGERQNFEGGYVLWTQATGAQTTFYDHKVVVDNSDPGFSASASWYTQTASDDYGSNYHRRLGTTTNSDPATWNFAPPHSGYYDVYVYYPTVSPATSSAAYTVYYSGGTAIRTLSQQTRAGRWNRLGSYYWSGTGDFKVELSSQGSSGQYKLADAVRIVGPVQGPDTTPPTVPVVTDDGQYTSSTTQLHASWESYDLESGIDHYEYAVGTSPTDPGSGYLVPWTSTGTQTSATASLELSHGVTYYFYVRSYNSVSLSSTGVSDGITVDTTPPNAAVLTDDGDYTGDPSMLHCAWLASDPESGIANYEYAVGTAPYAINVVPPTNAGTATQVWVGGLGLVSEQLYYFRVMSFNGAGLSSATFGLSDGIRYLSTPLVSTISQMLGYSDDTRVRVTGKPISAVFSDRLYIEELNRLRGIGVQRATSLSEGSLVDVTGTLDTLAGERILVPGAVTPVQ